MRDWVYPGDSHELRAAWCVEGKRVLLTVERIAACERHQGHGRVIAVIPDLVRRSHDVVYAIIGEGDDRERFEEIAREIGVAKRVRFFGTIDQQRLVAAYRMADLFVMPSTGEGFGIAFLQAMASGTPALGLDVAGACGALGEGKRGADIPKQDDLPDAITRLIIKPKSDPNALS